MFSQRKRYEQESTKKWHVEPVEEAVTTHIAPTTVGSSERQAATEARIEDYLDCVTAPLLALPGERCTGIRDELRSHLQALVTAHEELGASPDEAALAAQHQFGDPRRVGRDLARQWRRDPANVTFGRFYRRALVWFGGLAALNLVVVVALNQNHMVIPMPLWLYQTVLAGWFITGTPIVAGWQLGKNAPKVSGGLALVCALATLFVVLGSVGLRLLQIVRQPGLEQQVWVGCLWMAMFTVIWMPLGLVSSAVSARVAWRRVRAAR